MKKGAQSIIIVKKKKGHAHGHHGGSWKVAFADFMTAMMAFFLLMWLLQTTTPEQQEGIAGYFNDPSSKHLIGPGGADSAVIDMEVTPLTDTSSAPAELSPTELPQADESAPAAETMAAMEAEQLVALQGQLEAELERIDSALHALRDQILIDSTPLGLRIQIVDVEQRPMFDVGSSTMKDYSADVLQALGQILGNVPNKISITGHTDAMPYSDSAAYSNWELSADRANSARRALQRGGFPEEKIATIQGMGSVAPLLPQQPADAINRRIAIIVLKKAVADALAVGSMGIDSAELLVDPETPLKTMSDAGIESAIEASSSTEDQAN